MNPAASGRAVSVGTRAAPGSPVIRPHRWAGTDRVGTRSAEVLTTRESEVAELVGRGLSNPDIADHLGISRWTVVSHLRKIMRKWNCSSRVDVAVIVNSRRSRPAP